MQLNILFLVKISIISLFVLLGFQGNAQTMQKVIAVTRTNGDNNGAAVTMFGEYAAVGNYFDDLDENELNPAAAAGSVLIYQIDGLGVWNLTQKIVASDRSSSDWFGVELEMDGDYLVVSASGFDAKGAVYVYQRNGGGAYVQIQKIMAPIGYSGDRFGEDIDIQGTSLIVGDWYHDYNAANTNYLGGAGAAYIYDLSGGIFALTNKVVCQNRTSQGYFGKSVAIYGTTAVVGAQGDDLAEVFEKSGGVWNYSSTVTSPDGISGDNFGSRMDMSSAQLFVGAVNEDEDENGLNTMGNAGSVYVFEPGLSPTTVTINTNSLSGSHSAEATLTELINLDGGSPTWGVSADNWMFVDKGNLLDISSFDITPGVGFSSISAVTLHLTYSVESGYAGNNYVQYDGSNTTIQPLDGQTNATSVFDLYANGIDTWAEISALNISFLNNDGGGADGVSFDQIYLEVSGLSPGWASQQKIVPYDRAAWDAFGADFNVADTLMIIGSSGTSVDSLGANFLSSAGGAYIYDYDPGSGTWGFYEKIIGSQRGPNGWDSFGTAVDIYPGCKAVVGATGEDEDLTNSNLMHGAGCAYFYSCPIVIPLAAEIIEFTGEIIRDGNLIHWETVSETNNDLFELQRSRNGTDWTTIHSVQGAGTSTHTITYSFLDQTALSGINFYRIKQIDFDGFEDMTYSISLNNGLMTKKLLVFPNPTNSNVFVMHDLNISEGAVLKVIDQTGRVLQDKKLRGVKDESIKLNLSNFENGCYWIVLYSNEGLALTRSIIVKY